MSDAGPLDGTFDQTRPTPTSRALDEAARRAVAYLHGVDTRHVGGTASADELRERLGGPLPETPADPAAVVARLAEGADPGLVASAGPRYFGFVIGGAVPAAVGADWLASAWDQNAGLYVASPAAAVAEEVAGAWLLELLGLPRTASIGFTTGATMANFTGLAAARHAVLDRAGWDVERDGLYGAPEVHVVVGAERHTTVDLALRYLGFGAGRVHVVPADDQGRMRPDELRRVLSGLGGPLIVCAQAGNVNTGAFDPLDEICQATHAAGGWVHVDGAFGLWAAASPSRRHLVAGVEHADSWATDGHKWLNVPYDSGLVFVAHPGAHRAACSSPAAYLTPAGGQVREPLEWVPEASRRARGFAVWAAVASLGRAGIAELVDRDCDLATRFATRLGALPDTEILNDVVLNQVLVRFTDPDGDHDGRTRRVTARLQADGTMWVGPTSWQGRTAMRVSVSGWSTTEQDVDMAVAAVARAAAATDR